jgi:hypothetical protein
MQKLELTSNGVTAHLTLRNATIGDEMRRSMLAAQAFQTPLPDPAEQTAAVVLYPRCLACTVDGTVDGKQATKLTAVEFVALPAEIGEAWLNAALELNPAWNMSALSAEEQTSAEKKD